MGFILCSGLVSAQEFVPGELIVKFKQRTSIQAFSTKAKFKSLKYKGGWSSLNMHKFSITDGGSVLATAQDLQTDPDVEYVEPNYIFRKSQVNEDPSHIHVLNTSEVESLSVSAQSSGFNMTLAPIQAEDGWNSGTVGFGGNIPVVAVIDSGMDMDHEALGDALWVNPNEIAGNGVDDDGNGYVDDINGWDFVQNDANPDDVDGHGTHVAGIIRGVTQNIFSTPIGTPKIKIMVLRFLDGNGVGTTSDAIRAIYYAVNNGAHILNNSWGGGSYSRALHEAIIYSYDHHSLFVAASGNSAKNIDEVPMFPASYDVPNVLSIAATRDDDYIASFSNYGISSVHIASPGVAILSTYKNNGYAFLNGTSMATPFVAGVAALMWLEKPGMWGYQLKNLIVQSSTYKGNLSSRVSSSSRLNVYNSVVNSQGASIDHSQPYYTMQSSGLGRFMASSSGGSGGGGGCGRVTDTYRKMNGSGGGGKFDPGITILFVLPFLAFWLFRSTQPRTVAKRKFDRFIIDSGVSLKIGESEVVGRVSTISMGGAGISSPVALQPGSSIKMTITSPDGKESIEVEAKIVYSSADSRYGVCFDHLEKEEQATIHKWTQSLSKSAA